MLLAPLAKRTSSNTRCLIRHLMASANLEKCCQQCSCQALLVSPVSVHVLRHRWRCRTAKASSSVATFWILGLWHHSGRSGSLSITMYNNSSNNNNNNHKNNNNNNNNCFKA
ncbi:unnamed protein product [Polarella glacialis]|uniref:Uncharacterized protein n=1 Tax=Polarella glacialis TaxID=89957 RepID=A0A813GFC2_POLGL|nr:unnamed protein product [Polarella glacialis]CAE8648209.1 unnamed protein product [Polarella glacialis]